VIYSVNRINSLLDNIERKMKTVDHAFNAIDKVVDAFSLASDKVIDGVSSFVSKIFARNKKNKSERKDD